MGYKQAATSIIGQGRGTKYTLSDKFSNQVPVENLDDKEQSLGKKDANLANLNTSDMDNNDYKQFMEIVEEIREKKWVEKAIIERKILEICAVKQLIITEISDLLCRTKESVRKYVRKLIEENKLELLYPERASHPKQAYKTKQ